MSRENIEIAVRWFDAYKRRDFDRLIELNDPDFHMKSVFAGAETGGAFWAEGGGFPFAYFEAIEEAYEYFRVIAHDYIDAGAGVLVRADAEWRGKGSGVQAITPVFVGFWLRAKRVLREETFTDEAEAREALGLLRT